MDGGGLLPSDHLKGGAAQLPRPVPAPRRPAWARPGTRRTKSRKGSITGSGATLPSGSRVRITVIIPFGGKVKDVSKTAFLAVRCGFPNVTANICGAHRSLFPDNWEFNFYARQNVIAMSILESVQLQTVTGH